MIDCFCMTGNDKRRMDELSNNLCAHARDKQLGAIRRAQYFFDEFIREVESMVFKKIEEYDVLRKKIAKKELLGCVDSLCEELKEYFCGSISNLSLVVFHPTGESMYWDNFYRLYERNDSAWKKELLGKVEGRLSRHSAEIKRRLYGWVSIAIIAPLIVLAINHYILHF